MAPTTSNVTHVKKDLLVEVQDRFFAFETEALDSFSGTLLLAAFLWYSFSEVRAVSQWPLESAYASVQEQRPSPIFANPCSHNPHFFWLYHKMAQPKEGCLCAACASNTPFLGKSRAI